MNKLINYKPFYFLFFLIVGIILQNFLKIWSYNVQYLCLLFFLLILNLTLFYHLQKKIAFTIISFLTFILMGISAVFVSDSSNQKNYYGKIKGEDNTAIIKITAVLKSTSFYHKYEANILHINNKKSCGKILLKIKKDSLNNSLSIHQKLFIKPTFSELASSSNPYGFNYQNYLSKKGIHHQVSLNSNEYSLIENTSFSFLKEISGFRNHIQMTLKKYHFSRDELSIINALLLGQRQDISKELKNDYAKAGAIHILAISGLHIGIILLIITKLFRPFEKLKNGRFIKTLFIVFTLWLFAFFTGLSPSVIRATTMFTFIALGTIFQRTKIIEHSLITSMFFILLIKPSFLFDVGFQLSYLAVFGIIWVQPLLYKLWIPKYKLTNRLWQLITVSLAAQVGIFPISLYYFHQFPGLFLLSNIIIIPLLGVILIGGFIVIVLALFNILPDFAVIIYSYCIGLINTFIHWISQQEAFLFSNIPMSFWTMISFYILIIFCFQFIIKRKPQQLMMALMSIILIQVVYIYEKQLQNTQEEFIVFHKYQNSIMGLRKGEKFSVFHNLDSLTIKNENIINDYMVGNHISKSIFSTQKNIYRYKNHDILIIDSLGIYNIKKLQNPIVILQNNPKINIIRLISTLKPQQIIADGSNYNSYIKKWQETCKKEKTPFYNTRKNGAYIIK